MTNDNIRAEMKAYKVLVGSSVLGILFDIIEARRAPCPMLHYKKELVLY